MQSRHRSIENILLTTYLTTPNIIRTVHDQISGRRTVTLSKSHRCSNLGRENFSITFFFFFWWWVDFIREPCATKPFSNKKNFDSKTNISKPRFGLSQTVKHSNGREDAREGTKRSQEYWLQCDRERGWSPPSFAFTSSAFRERMGKRLSTTVSRWFPRRFLLWPRSFLHSFPSPRRRFPRKLLPSSGDLFAPDPRVDTD